MTLACSMVWNFTMISWWKLDLRGTFSLRCLCKRIRIHLHWSQDGDFPEESTLMEMNANFLPQIHIHICPTLLRKYHFHFQLLQFAWFWWFSLPGNRKIHSMAATTYNLNFAFRFYDTSSRAWLGCCVLHACRENSEIGPFLYIRFLLSATKKYDWSFLNITFNSVHQNSQYRAPTHYHKL